MNTLATNYYVSNSGNDATSGRSPLESWSSILKLNKAMAGSQPGDSVFFKRGDIFYGSININGSGTLDNPIYFGDYGTGTKPVITGLTQMTSWKKTGNNIWETDCNSGSTLNLVTIGGNAVAMGRYPDKGKYLTIDSSVGLTKFIDAALTTGNTNWTGAQLVIKTTEYSWDRCRISSQLGSMITYIPSSQHPSVKGFGYFLQDDKRTLTIQNEWWYDAINHKLLLYSTTDPSRINVKVSTIEYATNFHYKHYLTFNNIQFTGLDTTAIRSYGGINITVTNCGFNLIGTDALVFDQGSRIDLRHNTIDHIHNTGIRIVYSNYSKLVKNFIQNCGLTPGMGLSNNQQMNGILAENSGDSIVIDSNTIRRVGYCGITFSGRYTQIRNNYIDSFCLTIADGGGIYTCCNNLPGRVVSNNVITNGIGNHDATPFKKNSGAIPIYIDDHAAGVTILNNTVVNGTRYGIFLHNAHEITIRGNKIYNNAGSAAVGYIQDNLGKQDPLRNNVLSGNYIYAPAGSKMLEVYSLNNDIKTIGTFDSNYYSMPTTGDIISFVVTDGINTSFSANYTLDQWKSSHGFDRSSSLIHIPANQLRFELNTGKTDKVINLNNNWMDLKKKSYKGALTLKPNESIILTRDQAF
ncbi:MAG: right-handed parallel beta-helix repeat-containing protein [Chitinophagaceae bacterium]